MATPPSSGTPPTGAYARAEAFLSQQEQECEEAIRSTQARINQVYDSESQRIKEHDSRMREAQERELLELKKQEERQTQALLHQQSAFEQERERTQLAQAANQQAFATKLDERKRLQQEEIERRQREIDKGLSEVQHQANNNPPNPPPQSMHRPQNQVSAALPAPATTRGVTAGIMSQIFTPPPTQSGLNSQTSASAVPTTQGAIASLLSGQQQTFTPK